jgi:hypothetical protein
VPGLRKGEAAHRQPQRAQANSRQAQGKTSELEQLAAEYDQAISAYEAHFQRARQRAYALSRGWGGPTGAYAYDAGSTPATDWQSWEERLAFLEQTAADFAAAQSYLGNLTGDEKTAYVESWREYLTQTAEMGDELIADLERELGKGGDADALYRQFLAGAGTAVVESSP